MKKVLDYVRERYRDRAFLVISIIYAAFCIFSTVWWSVNFKASYLLMSALFILFIPAIIIAEWLIGMRCHSGFVILVLIVASGSILGSPFGLYSLIPHFDTFLHGTSGVLFACLGFTLAERFFGKADSRRKFAGSLIFAVAFSLAVAVLWEIHEYMCTIVLGMETMDDTIIHDFKSFVLGGSRLTPVILDGITKTIVEYGNGEVYIIEGGYLDIGLIDTVSDMIICTVGAALFALVSALTARKHPAVNRLFIPEATECIWLGHRDADAEAKTDSFENDEVTV